MSKTITSEKKDELFRLPESGTLHFGRHFATCFQNGAFHAAIQLGEGRQTRIAVMTERVDKQRAWVEGPAGLAYQPALAACNSGRVCLVWNEATEAGWRIQMASLEKDGRELTAPRTLHESGQLCLHPTAAFYGECLRVAWAERQGDVFRIVELEVAGDSVGQAGAVSIDGADAFRPRLATGGSRAALVWDEFRDGVHCIAAATADGSSGWHLLKPVSQVGERWLTPRVAVSASGEIALTWVGLIPVIDKLGIIDHRPVGMAAQIVDGIIKPLHDTSHPTETRTIAELRDGLLAGAIYKGYVGLRRNPFPAFDDKGRFWCFWEIRGESTDSTVAGPLLARKLEHDGSWSPVRTISEAGYGYAVPDRFEGTEVPFAHMRFDQSDRKVVATGRTDAGKGATRKFDESRWQRWQVEGIQAESPIERTLEDNGKSYRFYWADTHVHSVLSPDAEGELDELVHFARDQAGLNILTVIDNDYYPQKAVTEAEWRVHQAMAAHYSHGNFRWIPGYEFTNHRPDLKPDFNHRCVLYPSGKGELHRRIDPGTRVDSEMIPVLKNAGAMPYPHHCTYDIIDEDAEWNIEVTSSWRVCIEETDFTIKQLQQGRRLGFIGSSDTHRCVPGLGGARTAVLAENLSPEAVLDAYRNRRLIATQGHNLFVDFRVDGVLIGGMTETAQAPVITAEIETPLPLDYVELVRDGETVRLDRPHGRTLRFEWADDCISAGKHFYFLRIKMVGDPSFNRDGFAAATNNPQPFSQDSRYPHNLARARGPFAWTSPVWVIKKA